VADTKISKAFLPVVSHSMHMDVWYFHSLTQSVQALWFGLYAKARPWAWWCLHIL